MCFLCKRESGVFTQVSRIPKDLFIPNGRKRKAAMPPSFGPELGASISKPSLDPGATEGESLWGVVLHKVVPLVVVLGATVYLKRRGRGRVA